MEYNKGEVYSIPNTDEGKAFALEVFQKCEDKGYHVSRSDTKDFITIIADKVMETKN